MKKQLLNLFILFSLTLMSVETWGATTFTVSNIKYEVISATATDKTVKVIGTNSTTIAKIAIPDSVLYSSKKYRVTQIAPNAFKGNTKITEVTIPYTVSPIGRSAFEGCTAITSLSLGTSTGSRKIEPCAFKGCTGLKSLSISPSIGVIGDSAFMGCNKLETLQLTKYTDGKASKLTSIGKRAFYNCSALTTVVWNYPVASWLNIEFADSYANPVCYAKGLNEVKAGATVYSKVTSLSTPDEVNAIKQYAFYNCQTLTSVTIGSNVTTIGANAFYGCTGVTTVTFGAAGSNSKIATIGNSAFGSINSASSSTAKVVYYNTIDKWCSISFGTSTSNPLYKLNNLYIGGTATANKVTNASITSNISNYAFYNCTSLTSLVLGAYSPASIGTSAFAGCTNIEYIIAKKATAPTLSSAFPPTLNAIPVYVKDEDAFDSYHVATNWKNFTNYHYEKPTGVCGDNLTWTVDIANQKLTIEGTGAMYNYNNADNKAPWMEYKDKITSISYPNTMETVGDYAFYGMNKATSISDPKGTSIGAYAYYGCSAKTSAFWLDNVESIGEHAFANCSGFSQLRLGTSTNGLPLKQVGANAFSGCSKLTTVYTFSLADWINVEFANANANPIYPAKAAFYIGGNTESYKITDLEIPASSKEIKPYVFANCTTLTSVTLHNKIKSVGASAFTECSNIAKVSYYNSNGTSYQKSTLVYMDQWAQIEFGNQFANPIYHAKSLYATTKVGTYGPELVEQKSIVFADTTKQIKAYTFYNCNSITAINCKATTPPVAGTSAFTSTTTSTATLTVPAASKADYKTANVWKNFKTIMPIVVTFDLQGRGTNTITSISSPRAISQPVDPIADSEYYDFGGWYTDEACTDGKEYDFSTTVTEDLTLYAKWIKQSAIALSDNADNAAILAEFDGETVDVDLVRTLTTESFNTICLPFAVDATTVEAKFGVGTRIAELTGSNIADDCFNLQFVERTAMEAGVPYLIQPTQAVSSPTFTGVEIQATPQTRSTAHVDFNGIYSPYTFGGGNENYLFLGSSNTLYWAEAGTMKGMRAYFILKPGAGVQAGMRARVVMQENTTTGVGNIYDDNDNDAQRANDNHNVRKVLRNGQLVIVRDGVTYNAVGGVVEVK